MPFGYCALRELMPGQCGWRQTPESLRLRIERFRRTKNWDTVKGLKVAQALVAGDDLTDTGGERTGERHVIVGVRGTRCDRGGENGFHQRFIGRERVAGGAALALKPTPDVFALEHFGKLGNKFHRAEKLDLSLGDKFNQTARSSLAQDRRKRHIGIKHQAHRAWLDARRARPRFRPGFPLRSSLAVRA
jgi:hypothetical protein